MTKYPGIDLPGSVVVAEAITDIGQFEMMHDVAERTSDLYRVGHSVISAALGPSELGSNVDRAILAGVTAYEVFGSVVQSAEELAGYKRDDVLNLCGRSRGMTDTLASFDDALTDLNRLPELVNSMRVLVEHIGIHPSSSQMEYALYGAAMLRKLQLELDEVIAFRVELDSL